MNAQLSGHNDELEMRWMRFLEQPFNAERTHVIRWHEGIDRDVPAGIVLAQAVHHGSDHRSQICTILTTLGLTIPPIGLWDYAEATDRAGRRAA